MISLALTKAIPLITGTSSIVPNFFCQWTMTPIIMLVSDLFEEMDLVFSCKERSSNAMHWCISPTLDVR